MADAYQARYGKLTHQQLFDQLMAGDPDQVELTAAKFSTLRDTVEGVRTSLDADLLSLSQSWNGDAWAEFQDRMGLVSSFAHALHNDFDALHGTLTQWAGLLREAKKRAEDPADTDNSDKTIKDAAAGAAIGATVAGPGGAVVGGVIGGIFGHSQDDEEKQKARERMVTLVAGLAADYEVNDRLPPDAAPVPVNLPQTVSNTTLVVAAGPSVPTPGGVSALGNGALDGQPAPSATAHSGSDLVSLAGDGGPVGGDNPAVSGDGSAPSVTGLLGVGGGSLSPPGGLAAAAAGLGAAAIVPGLGAGAGGSAVEVAAAEGGTGVKPGNLFSGAKGAAVGEDALGIDRDNGRGAAARQASPDDEGDEHSTWLTEDEMVWGNDQRDAPPTVLGGEPASQ